MTSSPTRGRGSRFLNVAGLVLIYHALAVSAASARDKTDVVVLGNGDHLTCEIETLERGRLTVKTDSMGTLQIQWDDVQELTSSARFEVELDSGEKFSGALAPAPDDGQLIVIGDTEAVLARASVVRIREIGEGFWNQIQGSMAVGFNFTKANDAKQWSFSGEGVRRTERFETRVTLNSLFSSQEGIDAANRHTLGIQVSRFFPGRWIAATVAQFQRNDELTSISARS